MSQRKIHLRANKLNGTNEARSFCSTVMVNGKCHYNNRSKYRFMASEIVSFKEFREIEPSKRCAHCVDNGLITRNKLRKMRGLEPVTNINDAFIAE